MAEVQDAVWGFATNADKLDDSSDRKPLKIQEMGENYYIWRKIKTASNPRGFEKLGAPGPVPRSHRLFARGVRDVRTRSTSASDIGLKIGRG